MSRWRLGRFGTPIAMRWLRWSRLRAALAERLAIARDTLGELRAQVAEGREADLLLLTGGVSMGKYDLVEQVLREFRRGVLLYGRADSAGQADGVWAVAIEATAVDIFLWAAGKSGVDAGLLCSVCGSDAAGAGGEDGDCAGVCGGSAGGGGEGWGEGDSVSAGGDCGRLGWGEREGCGLAGFGGRGGECSREWVCGASGGGGALPCRADGARAAAVGSTP